MSSKLSISIVLLCVCAHHLAEGRLEPTKLVHEGIFKLQNQHDGRFLTEGTDGVPRKAEFSGSLAQKFKFVKSEEKGEEAWTLIPLSSKKSLTSTTWKISYVGHGKYQFKSLRSGKCLQVSGVTEADCGKGNPLQRWFADVTSEKESS